MSRTAKPGPKGGSGTSEPNRALVNVTGRCNSRCGYCMAWRKKDTGGEPTCAELKSLLAQAADLGCTGVGFSGGEPLLRDDLEQCVESAVGHGLSTWLVTNGLLLSGERVSGLAASGLEGLSVSLDSLDPETYREIRGVRLEKVLANLVHAAGLGLLTMGIAVTISKINVRNLRKLVDFAADCGLQVSFQLYEEDVHLAASMSSLRPEPEELQAAVEELCALKQGGSPVSNSLEYLRSLPRYVRSGEWAGLSRCLAPEKEICVDESMNVHVCWGLDRVMGNLRQASLSDIWGSPAFRKARLELKGCRKCILSCHFENSLRMLGE